MSKRQSVELSKLPDPIRALVPGFSIPDPFEAPSLRWGIIGAGTIASVFATDVPKYSSQKIAAVGSRSAKKAEAFAARHGIGEACGSYEELVSSRAVDAVYVATPHILHAEHALLALRHDKPVLVEKPFTMSVSEAKTVFQEADRRGLFVMEGMWSRHLPHYRLLSELAARNACGEPRRVSAHMGGKLQEAVPRLVDPALGGGALLDIGVYTLSLAQMLLGNPTELRALGTLLPTGVDEDQVVIGKYRRGLSMTSSGFSSPSPNAAEIAYEDLTVAIRSHFYKPGVVDFYRQSDAESGTPFASWDATVPGGFQFEAAAAAECIVAGQLECLQVSWEDTLQVQGMLDTVRVELGVR